ncbi:MAG: Gfo/Idh/MocA family oxidoreductase [Anaerolineae bacterium]
MSNNHKTPAMKVGIIGVGNISPAYIKGCRMFDNLELVACADIDLDRAKSVAAENNIPHAFSVEEILAQPDIDILINLTIPKAHSAVSLRVIEAGKHVYSEKPLATTFEDGQAIMAAAAAKGVRVGCAPDTFMFGPHQAARHILIRALSARRWRRWASWLVTVPKSGILIPNSSTSRVAVRC